MEELELKKRRVYFVKKKNKLNKYNIGIYSDPLNPYLTNWTRSFLKIGFNTGIWANKAQYGVPLLRLQRLRPKLEFPPIYKIKYNQFSEEKNYKNNYNITYNDNKKINDEYSLDSSLNNFFNLDRKFNSDKNISIEEKHKAIDVAKINEDYLLII